MQLVQTLADALAALDMQKRRHCASRSRRLDLCHATAEADCVGALGIKADQDRGLLHRHAMRGVGVDRRMGAKCGRGVRRGLWITGNPDGKEPACQTTRLRMGQRNSALPPLQKGLAVAVLHGPKARKQVVVSVKDGLGHGVLHSAADWT